MAPSFALKSAHTLNSKCDPIGSSWRDPWDASQIIQDGT